MTNGRRLGVIGGTFDPIHYGHLDAADAARTALALDEILVVPTHDPPHRPVDPRATAFHRFALAALAIDGRDGWRLSDMELRRPGRSYTWDTLRALHESGWDASQIFFILGTDAFAEIASWRAYPEVLDAANFVVIARPGTTLAQALARTPDLVARAGTPAGAGAAPERTRVVLVEANTRDVSSTIIRQRLTAGQAIDDLVPPAVVRHILVHALYRAEDDLHGKDERDQDQHAH